MAEGTARTPEERENGENRFRGEGGECKTLRTPKMPRVFVLCCEGGEKKIIAQTNEKMKLKSSAFWVEI